jgi:hypothetical protein
MRRRAKPGLTPEAIAAWQACDYNALHCALNLYPHEQSPLPEEVISSHQGTGSDLASRRRNLQEAKARVAWRRKLLRDLDEKAPT